MDKSTCDLVHPRTAIYIESLTGNMARFVACHPNDSLGDIFARRQSSKWDDVTHHAFCRVKVYALPSSEVVGLSHVHFGVDRAWADTIYTDAILGIGHCEALR